MPTLTRKSTEMIYAFWSPFKLIIHTNIHDVKCVCMSKKIYCWFAMNAANSLIIAF